MSRKWWLVVFASLLIGAILVVVGFSVFETQGFLENLIAEAIGLAFGFALVVWFIEGPVLTRERRFQAMLAYKRRVYRIVSEIGLMLAKEIAEPLAHHFDPPTDFDAYELDRWSALQPVLRGFYSMLREVTDKGLPTHADLSLADVESSFSACESMYRHVKREIDSNPELRKYVARQEGALESITHHIEWSRRVGQLEDMSMRYRAIGELGSQLLDLLESITPQPEESESE